ncbi:hypothetical protein LTS08_005847 [Lithohypha guttulata]|uniref:uncharacterized protein n=1 Tax=Lithohypha guttulata TaxID=1690604 RepID=UPI002DDF20DA|nr:hypothetical protein LTR51_002360 [Lithohypha guttulata]KAK5099266.1 hypothetical protein LTS08_005847 [Lithohypha guttulata]
MPYQYGHFPPNELYGYDYTQQYVQPYTGNVHPQNQVQVVVPQRQSFNPHLLNQSPSQPANNYPSQLPQPQFANNPGFDQGPYYNQASLLQNNQLYPQENSGYTASNQYYHQPQQYQSQRQPQVVVPPSPVRQIQQQQVAAPAIATPVVYHHNRMPSNPAQPHPRPSPVHSIPVVRVPPRQAMPESSILQQTKTNTPRQSSAQKPWTESAPEIPSAQYPSVLLSLADEYLEASRCMDERTEDYYSIVATALACMETTLKNFKLSPLREAQVSLKYAQALYDETDNLDVAETTLSRSIDLCGRMNLVDLKYAMQLLLAKVLFRSKPKAAMRDLQAMIQDIETYRHSAWEYSFRFQAAFFDLELSAASNLHDAVHQLERIQHIARQNNDHTVYAFAALLESLVHLNDTAQESVTHAQSALAKARSLQLNPEIATHPQVSSMMDLLDVVCSLQNGKTTTEDLLQRRKNMAKTISDAVQRNPHWAKDELLWLRINPTSLRGVATQDCGLVQEVDGKYYIALTWMGKLELEGVGYLVNSICWTLASQAFHDKARAYMREGYRIPNDEIPNPPNSENGTKPPKPITIKDNEFRNRSHLLAAHFQSEVALLSYAQGPLDDCPKALKALEGHLARTKQVPQEYKALIDYLKGCIYQANGNLGAAVKHFQSPDLALQPKQRSDQTPNQKHQQANRKDTILLQLQLLAAMNVANIIRSLSHPQHHHLQTLFATISSHMTPNSPANIRSAYNVLLAAMPADSTTLQVKSVLSTAMYLGRDTKNHQISSIALALIQDRFFRGGVQDKQAAKSARTAAYMVRDKWQNALWWAICGNMEVESLLLQVQSQGLPKGTPEHAKAWDEIRAKREEVQRAWQRVPPRVQQEMQR